ncbi:MAG: hypothetical protein WCC17_17060 [Candidatus Nitrosopolaris sp.]
MTTSVSNANTLASEIGCDCVAAGRVLRTRNTRSRPSQNIYNLLYDIRKTAIEKSIIATIIEQTPICENIIFLRVCGGLRGLV